MNIPENLKYTKDHEWIRVEGEEAYVGITDYAQAELGEIIYVDINTVGEQLSKGDTFGTVEAVKAVSDLFLPASGEVLAQNSTLDGQPELVNQDPYQEGWMIRLALSDASELDDLMDATAYAAMIKALKEKK